MKGRIASGSLYTSEAGQFAFEQGGNAFDALISAQLAACVAEPLLTGLGGSGLAVIKHHEHFRFLDMFTTMPQFGPEGWSSEHLQKVVLDFGTTTQSFHVGKYSITTPTVPQGIMALYREYASLPLETLIEPACKLAEEGFYINEMSEFILKLLYPIYSKNQMMCKWYTKNGRPLRTGEMCKPIEMKDDFIRLAKYGEEFWSALTHKGKTLHNSVVNEIHKYTAKFQDVHELKIGNFKIYMPNLPSIGGIITKEILESGRSLNNLEDIKTYIDLSNIAMNKCETEVSNLYCNGGSGFTTHISVVDDQGSAISMTTSLGETSGLTISNTGIVMNNFLGEADVAHPLAIQHPGSRLITMCTPMILEGPNETVALGSGGSSRIPHALSQVVLQYCSDEDTTWQEAIHASRIFPNFSKNFELCIEQHTLAQNFVSELQSYFEDSLKIFESSSMYFGGVHVASIQTIDGQVVFGGEADRRRQGAIL